MFHVIFLAMFVTAICKTGCSPVFPTGNVLASANCLLDYCCMLFLSTESRPLIEKRLMSVDEAEASGGHLPKQPFMAESDDRVFCKDSLHEVDRKPKNSQLLCRHFYDQRTIYEQSQCRFLVNRRPQEDVLIRKKAALGRRRSHRSMDLRVIGKLRTQHPISARWNPLLEVASKRKRQSEDRMTAASGEQRKVSNVLAVYKLWRDANGYGKQNARWGRSSSNRSWGPDQREITKERRNGVMKEDPSFSRVSHERRELFNSTGKRTHSTINDQPKLKALQKPDLEATRRLVDTAGGKAIRRKRTHLEGPSRLTSGEDFSPEMKEVLEGYLIWRSRNGYGRLAGRWG